MFQNQIKTDLFTILTSAEYSEVNKAIIYYCNSKFWNKNSCFPGRNVGLSDVTAIGWFIQNYNTGKMTFSNFFLIEPWYELINEINLCQIYI